MTTPRKGVKLVLHSNNYQVKEAVRRYLLDCINLENYDIDETRMSDGKRVLKCYDIFLIEKRYEFKPWFNAREVFQDWLQGLASACSLPFLYPTSPEEFPVKLLANWLQMSKEEAQEVDEYNATYRCLHLCVREFFAMLECAQLGRPLFKEE